MNNPLQLVRAFRNPEQFMQQMMNNNNVMNNPIGRNAMEMFQNNDQKGLEELARNMCKERNLDVDDVINQLKSQFGM